MIVRFPMTARAWIFLCLAAAAQASVPTPREYLGFQPGDDYKLADYAQIAGYFQTLARVSDRIRLVEYGRSSLGKPMYVAFLSAPENLSRLDRYREISRRLALGQVQAGDARALAAEGKVVVWIDSGLHASEVAPVQHAPELAYRMVSGEDEETRAIRQNVVLMQVPAINPDGLDWIVHWYRPNTGTPYEAAPLPWLYQKYAGHDNNRDWFMLNLEETRHTARLLFREWFPQIVYNQHQAPPFPARIFIPPYAEPLNPHIPSTVMEGINLIGMAMKERFARENKPGVLSYWGFDAWWDGGLRSVPEFHNMHGILTETALNSYATPRTYDPKDFPANFGNGIPAREPSVFYERPWMGGKWGTRDAIDYMLTADFAILSHAATKRADYLLKSYEMARAAIEAGERGKPYAYVIAPEQWDQPTALEMLERLSLAGVEVRRAAVPFHAGGKQYPAGTFVLPAAQPFRPYLMDLLEPQKYPELKSGVSGPAKRPYDIAGWTLSMQMGVTVDRVDEKFEAELAPVEEFRTEGAVSGSGTLVMLDHRENASFLATAFLLERAERIEWTADGGIVIDSAYVNGPARTENFARQFGVAVTLATARSAKPVFELKRPRVALYQPWVANADEGWTEWLLDRYRVPYTLVHNDDLRQPGLRSRFDTLILASQSADSILHGVRHGEMTPPGDHSERVPEVTVQRPEYAGGIEIAGLGTLQQFVASGGTLVALDTASELPMHYFPLPLRNLVRPGSEFYCPGSLIRLTVDTTQPLAFGLPKEVIAFSSGGEAFDITLAADYNKGEREIRTVAKFAKVNLLASGWVSGAQVVEGKAALAEVRYGQGRVVLFAFRPQFRGQPHGTFKFLLNAIYLGSAQRL
jgi:hypothetical protein